MGRGAGVHLNSRLTFHIFLVSGDTVRQQEIKILREWRRRSELLRLKRTLENEKAQEEEKQRRKREMKSNLKVSHKQSNKSVWTRIKKVFRSRKQIYTDIDEYQIINIT